MKSVRKITKRNFLSSSPVKMKRTHLKWFKSKIKIMQLHKIKLRAGAKYLMNKYQIFQAISIIPKSAI